MVSKVTTIAVKMEPWPATWNVRDHEMSTVDGVQCVRLCTRNSSLTSSTVGDPNVYKELKKEPSFKGWATALPGYRALLKLRNDTQARAEAEATTADDEGGCSLFGPVTKTVSPDKPSKRKRA